MQLNKDGYRKPEEFYVSSQYAKLYELEAQLHNKVHACAKEWAKVAFTDVEPAPGDLNFFRHTLPQVLYDLLGSYDNQSSMLAAKAFLDHMETKLSERAVRAILEVKETK